MKKEIKTIVTRRDSILNPSPLATARLWLNQPGRLHYFGRLGRQQLTMNRGSTRQADLPLDRVVDTTVVEEVLRERR
jgi:hypothetical protein